MILNPMNVTPAHGSTSKIWSIMIDVLFQWWRYEYKTRYTFLLELVLSTFQDLKVLGLGLDVT